MNNNKPMFKNIITKGTYLIDVTFVGLRGAIQRGRGPHLEQPRRPEAAPVEEVSQACQHRH